MTPGSHTNQTPTVLSPPQRAVPHTPSCISRGSPALFMPVPLKTQLRHSLPRPQSRAEAEQGGQGRRGEAGLGAAEPVLHQAAPPQAAAAVPAPPSSSSSSSFLLLLLLVFLSPPPQRPARLLSPPLAVPPGRPAAAPSLLWMGRQHPTAWPPSRTGSYGSRATMDITRATPARKVRLALPASPLCVCVSVCVSGGAAEPPTKCPPQRGRLAAPSLPLPAVPSGEAAESGALRPAPPGAGGRPDIGVRPLSPLSGPPGAGGAPPGFVCVWPGGDEPGFCLTTSLPAAPSCSQRSGGVRGSPALCSFSIFSLLLLGLLSTPLTPSSPANPSSEVWFA